MQVLKCVDDGQGEVAGARLLLRLPIHHVSQGMDTWILLMQHVKVCSRPVALTSLTAASFCSTVRTAVVGTAAAHCWGKIMRLLPWRSWLHLHCDNTLP